MGMQCLQDAVGMQETHGHSTPDRNFPSPTATPTNGSFCQNIFETPKASAYPTHFQDAFTTPQMQPYATPQQAQYQSMTPMQNMATQEGYTNGQHVQQQGGAQMVHPGNTPLHQGHFMASPTFATSPSAANTSFGSIQVQTPPPTRGTSARKPQQRQQIEFGTPSTIASRRFMTPQQVVPSNGPAPFPHQSPMQFPHMQFSPDINQFVNLGAASAPVMPQSRMLWEQQGSPRQPVSPRLTTLLLRIRISQISGLQHLAHRAAMCSRSALIRRRWIAFQCKHCILDRRLLLLCSSLRPESIRRSCTAHRQSRSPDRTAGRAKRDHPRRKSMRI